MHTVVVQIYRFCPEIEMLRSMSSEFLKRGFKMILWTNTDEASVGVSTIPLLFNEPTVSILDLAKSNLSDCQEIDAWKKYISTLERTYQKSFPEYSVHRWYCASSFLFEKLRPSLFLCWAGLEPCYAIPRRIAEERGIPTIIWEAGMLPSTLYINLGGIAGESDWCEKPLPELDDESIKQANRYLSVWRTQILDKVGSNQPQVNTTGKKLCVLVLGGMDLTNGVRYARGGCLTLPGFKDGVDVALQVSKSHAGRTLYRPHPREPVASLARLASESVKVDRETPLEQMLLMADVVIGYGSKADFVAMALGKPFVMVGRGLISGKDCAYEALSSRDLPSAIGSAFKGENADLHKENFQKFVAFLLSQGHYNRGSSGSCRLGVQELTLDVLQHADTNFVGGNFLDVFSDEGRIWWEKTVAEYRLSKRLTKISDPIAAIRAYTRADEREAQFIFDFDHTLWLGNSTEQFVGSIRPRIWGEFLNRISKLIWHSGQRLLPLELDQFRVLILILAAPWSWFLWVYSSKSSVRRYWNEKLFEVTQSDLKLTPIIVSFGFKPLIQPLINARCQTMPGSPKPLLVASGLLHQKRSLRPNGKVAALEKRFPNLVWTQTIAVSDSLEDQDLLTKAKLGILAKWNEPAWKPCPGYLPLRYVSKGKYPGSHYVRDFIVGQDLVVWVILLVSSLSDLIPTVLLFLSFQAIYEIGYYENDFSAAKQENCPTLSTLHLCYVNYRMDLPAWAWATISSFAGLYLLSGSVDWCFFGAWIGLLLILRFTFYAYNHQPPERRLPLYILLQSLKNFGGLVALQPTSVGLILGISHMFQHSTVYMIYRCKGDKSLFPRSFMRLCIFGIGLAITFLMGIKVSLLHLAASLIWLIYPVLKGKHGYRYFASSIASGLKNRLRN